MAKRKVKPRLNKHGVTMGEELLKSERKRETLEDYKARVALGLQYAAEEQAAWEDFCNTFPLT
jgi:hypothetical protein